MELYSNFVLHKNVMKSKQVVHSHEWHRVDIAVSCEECSEILVLAIRLIVVIKLHHIEVFFGIKELVLVV